MVSGDPRALGQRGCGDDLGHKVHREAVKVLLVAARLCIERLRRHAGVHDAAEQAREKIRRIDLAHKPASPSAQIVEKD